MRQRMYGMKGILLTAGLLWLSPFEPLCQQLAKLVEGEAISLEGVLGLARVGNNHYLVITPDRSYEAHFDADDHKIVRVVQISLQGQEDALRSAIGHRVQVSGVVHLNAESPFYLNGALIAAKSVRLPNKTFLLAHATLLPAASDSLTQFHALVTFTPRLRKQFSYSVWDADGHSIPSSSAYLSCGLNGPGDVINCFCSNGFIFSGSGMIRNGRYTKTDAYTENRTFAQFALPDPVHKSFSRAFECTRSPTR